MNCCSAVAVLALVLAMPVPAVAHPHIFVRYDVAVTPGDAGFMKLHFTFKINAPPNPLFTPGAQTADNPQLERDMLANLAAHPFYIYLDMDGQNLGRQEVRPILSGDVYVFDLTLPDTNADFGFSLYDPEYFVTVSLNDADSVKVKLNKITCATEEQKVGTTPWGIIRAQHIECGSKSGAKSLPHNFAKQPPGDVPSSRPDAIGNEGFVP